LETVPEKAAVLRVDDTRTGAYPSRQVTLVMELLVVAQALTKDAPRTKLLNPVLH